MSKYLSAESILATEDFQYADMECPEWCGMVRVRSLSGGQCSIITQKVQSKETEDLEELLVVMCCVNEDGVRKAVGKWITQAECDEILGE